MSSDHSEIEMKIGNREFSGKSSKYSETNNELLNNQCGKLDQKGN